MGFATLEKVKLLMGIPDSDTSLDGEIQCAVDGVNGELLDLFGLEQCAPQVYEETLDILMRDDGQDFVKTRAYPIVQLVEVKDTCSTSAFDSTKVYTRPLGQVLLTTGCFRYGKQTTKVTFLAGFKPGSRALAAISNAANQAAIVYVNTQGKGGFIEEQIGAYKVKLGSPSNNGMISANGLPMSWGRIVCRYTRAFAHVS